MSHPDPAAAPDTRPLERGEAWENPVTRERAVLIEAPWWNDAGRAVADLTALPGARVVGEHRHPALHESFTVWQGELRVLRDVALIATEFADVIVFRKPPAGVQRVLFGALAPIARRRGYRATYPSLSRTTFAPRHAHSAEAPGRADVRGSEPL